MKNLKKIVLIDCLLFLLLLSSCEQNAEQKHFEKHQHEFEELINYYYQIIPEDKIVLIEFTNNSTLDRLQITDIDTITKSISPIFFEWNIKVDNIPDSILAELNWNKEILQTLKNKLDNVDCLSISNEKPIEIGYKRFFLGMTSYYIFRNYDFKELEDIRNHRTDLHFFCDSVAWCYETGAY